VMELTIHGVVHGRDVIALLSESEAAVVANRSARCRIRMAGTSELASYSDFARPG
jgi:hypothetical protein